MVFSILCLFTFLLVSAKQSLSDPRATEVVRICSNNTASESDRRTFVTIFGASLDELTPLVAAQNYGAVIKGSGNTTVYAFGECMKDLSRSDCDHCFAQVKIRILSCLAIQYLTKAARIFFDGCYVRYDDYMFFNESLSFLDKTVCGSGDFVGNGTLFRESVVELVRNLSVEGAVMRNDGFSVGSVRRGNLTVYGLAQCWEFVNNGSGCEECLANSAFRIESCIPKDEGRILNAGCYLRYSTQKFFYNNSGTTTASPGNEGGQRRLAVILGSTSAAVVFLLIVLTISFFERNKLMKKRRERKQLGALLATVNKSRLNFSYDILERATNYFHHSNKLGQGGSGSVYKGILPDGQSVAVKRLFFNTIQWVDHFFNEVNLISDINHKNLVKLLGCSITGPESLLVYEFVPNQSLHDHLFVVKNNVRPLGWEVRYKVILGVAEGLAYLHEESNLRIIHRDIKLSNILLDEDYNAKIADFGLARLFPEEETHISTAIAGTLGYMAPEYVVRGKLTEKADVYSFGVLLIEVVSGKRNNSFAQNSHSILQMAWSLGELGRLCEAVDPTLEGKFQEEEADKLLQIGLLCIQASAELRPSMSTVVKMFYNKHEIARPTQPAFLNSSSAEISPYNKAGISQSRPESHIQSSGNSILETFIEPR